jgi:hypothetical protein
MARYKFLAAGVSTLALTVGFVTPASAQDNDTDVLSAIQAAAPEVLDAVADNGDPVEVTDAAAVVESGDLTTTIPDDASDGITIAAKGEEAISIGLPNAESAEEAHEEAPGIVSYDNGDGSTTVPVAKPDGSVQITTVIDGPEAPHEYEYPLDLPAGATLEQDGSGFVSILSADGEFLGGVAPAWAKDATGNDVSTRYEIDGTTLTQIVAHSASDAYPVVADPWLGVDLISRTIWTSSLTTLQVYPTDWGRNAPIAARWAALAEVQTKTPGTREDSSSMKDQLLCHFDARIYDPGKTSWNIDTFRPYIVYTKLVFAKCNN